MARRYEVRAWESLRDNTLEAVIADNQTSKDDPAARFVQHDSLDFNDDPREGVFYLHVDDTMAWRHGGPGAGLSLITDIVGDDVFYRSFMGDKDKTWQEATDLLHTFEYNLRNGEMFPLKLTRRPSGRVLPKGVSYQPGAGLQVNQGGER